MKVWVDADAVPGVIKEIILRAVIKRVIPTIFVANRPIAVPASPNVSTIQVSQGPDEADRYIAEHATHEDIVITQDIPLAAILVPLGAAVISVHGNLFTDANIGERLFVRNMMQEIRDTGGRTGGPKPYSEKDKQQFANTFDRTITKKLKEAGAV
ncbi:MAG: YaiI/YqxD family protein [Gammaproteobacteria bacterium]|nr:YaiI/YqxD family protein [Gammaproteobacteria bacterium]